MSVVSEIIGNLYQTAKELQDKYLTNKIERNPEGQITWIQYGEPIEENAEPEHLLEIDDAIRRALKKGWDPNDETDLVCRYSYFLWQSVESSYLHRTADAILKEGDIMEKIKLGFVSTEFPFYLDSQGYLYLKIKKSSGTIYQAFYWSDRIGNYRYAERPIIGPAMQFREEKIKNHYTKEISKPVYTSKEVEEFEIEDDHPLAKESIYKELQGVYTE